MPRTIISLSESEKLWLTQKARAEQVPMTEIVRRALALYRREAHEPQEPGFEDLLDLTRGLWRKGEGLAYQRQIRDEWEPEAERR
ncbi:CopG family transcriptional regulator [Methylocapsa palsarum]|uniref:Ribbon-helix-helix protein, copG family n=1 Tax=Methylocapsa palsarum TaxID=1612308 RepID=A0A1I4CNI7_9HYPH|nr:CopG family transcriptional regulator [Methylocapsa palsarum]SFK82808.1 hypothetical protein SAMN05444581_12621 [Methylocapsa palsarum]